MKKIKLTVRLFLSLWLVLLLQGCETLIGPYSPTTYKYATSLKVETLALMSKATSSYGKHKNDVEKLTIDLNKAHEFVKGVPSNSISSKQWKILIKPDGKLIGKFWSKWKQKSKLSKPYIGEFKKIVADSFDQIICLEVNKEKATDCLTIGERK